MWREACSQMEDYFLHQEVYQVMIWTAPGAEVKSNSCRINTK